MDCEIQLRSGKSMRLEEALLFKDHLYSPVLAHVKSCKACHPEEVVKGYLKNLESRQKRFQDSFSGKICRFLLKFEKIAHDRALDFDPKLVNKIIIKCVAVEPLLQHEDRLSWNELFQALDTHIAYRVLSWGSFKLNALENIEGTLTRVCVRKKKDVRASRLFKAIRAYPLISSREDIDEKKLDMILQAAEVHGT